MARRTMDAVEAANYLHYSVRTLYNKCSRREIPHYKVGRSILFYEDEPEEFIEAGKVCTNADFARLADMKLLELDMKSRLRRVC